MMLKIVSHMTIAAAVATAVLVAGQAASNIPRDTYLPARYVMAVKTVDGQRLFRYFDSVTECEAESVDLDQTFGEFIEVIECI